MNRISMAALAAALIGCNAHAASDFVDTAQVISSKPKIERVTETRQECDPAPAAKKDTSIVAPIIGGIAGGLLGHQVGQGSGQTAATIVGATGGAVAGSAVANRSSPQQAQQCRTVESSREVVNGYDVVYRYNGRDANVILPYNPGNTIKVGVSVILDDRPADSDRRSGDGNARPNYPAGGGDNQPYRRPRSQY